MKEIYKKRITFTSKRSGEKNMMRRIPNLFDLVHKLIISYTLQ